MMTGAAMAALIVQNIKAVNGDVDSDQETLLLAHWEPICDGIILHIQTTAVVTTTVAGGSSSGSHPGVIL